ncbi:hypothetical protein WOLCODRAFT_135276 [Wolfiporia cocos MD-104 SS10]|uniref:Uncharacterized protein n=1 Tax=Wolfiporia cocos (strain MD-104) TaxID=742152 RepID=A0A2H3J7U4_WOLCO|nr:hypothetical protein WOLCODRAFT_135276 [Wolfiporia cocos MD-104 SS10]
MAENDPSASSAASESYEPKQALQAASAVGLQAAGVGAFVSAIQNALGSHSSGAAGVLTRTGGTIGFFAAMGATFAFTEAAVANNRQKDDAVNGAAGACAAGFLAGIRSRSLPLAIASCAVLGSVMGTFDYAGKALQTPVSQEERRQRFFKHTPPTHAAHSSASE